MGLYKGQINSGSFKKGEHRSIKTEFKKGSHKSKKTEFKKGSIPWNKDKKHSKETIMKIKEKSKERI